MRVLAAMSGGVDSAVAAARLVAAGHDVTGVHLALSRTPLAYREGSRGCCSLEDSFDARRAADRLGIPFYVWDFSQRFAEEVIHPFIDEYRAGRTPNPCLRCNERIKFAAVLERGMDLGFDAVATGHYARLDATGDLTRMYRAIDPGKDQSYVLAVLNQDQLSHCLFPLGDSLKTDVRAEAARLGLSVADKPDSYDICFIPDGDTKAWLADKIPMRPGLIRDEDGAVLGEHEGAMSFTVGQRRGLSLERPAVDGRPRYVTGVDARSNTVTVGGRAALFVDALTGIRTSWCGEPPADLGRGEGAAIECEVQIRAHSEPVPARAWLGACESEPPASEFDVPAVRPAGQLLHVRTAEPLTGVAPGQTMVLYRGTRVLGQATIDRTARWEEGGAAPAQQPEPAGAGAALD